MIRTRLTAIIRAGAAALLLAGVVLGLPVLLALLVGWPMPGLDELRRSLADGYLPDGFVIGVLVAAMWLLWAELTVVVVAETAGVLRGRPARQIPLSAGLQPTIGRLVATIALLATVAGPRQASAIRPLPTGAPSRSLGVPTSVVDRAIESSPTPAAPVTVTPTYTVRPHDDLWTIAERHLGDPFRWKEIYELNRGRPLQPHGQVLTDKDFILPGWVLHLPADAVGLAPPAPTPSAVVPAPPAATPAPPTVTTTPATTQLPHPGAAGRAEPAAASVHTGDARDEHDPPLTRELPAGALALVMLVAGSVVWRLDLLRRVRLRRRRPGRRLPTPEPELAPVEERLRSIAASDAVAWVDALVRALTPALRSVEPAARPTVVAVRVGELGVEVLLDRVAAAPDGFVAVDEGRSWRVGADVSLDELRAVGEGHGSAVPALVTVGGTAEGPVLVNFEHLSALRVDGAADRVRAFLNGVATELATAPWATDVRVLVDPELAAASIPDVEPLGDPARATAQLSAQQANAAASLGEETAVSARLDPAGDDWSPTVVVGASTDLSGLFDVLQPGRAVAVVSAGPGTTVHRLLVREDGTARLDPLGLAVSITGLSDDDVAGTAQLLRHASDAPEESDVCPASADTPDAEVVIDLTVEEPPPTTVTPSVHVRVLGAVEVVGWDSPPSRPKAVELVTYLASHDRPVQQDRLREALWSDAVSDATFKSAVSRSRRCLGTDNAGVDHLRPMQEGRYQMGPEVSCDWLEFRRHVAVAARADDEEAIVSLRAALSLVRGRPFDDVAANTYTWASSEQLISAIEVAVADAAMELGRRALAVGDIATAVFAATKGLLACPGHEALYQLRMAAAGQAGDFDAVDQAFREAQRAARALDPLDDVQPQTRKLYEQLRTHVTTPRPVLVGVDQESRRPL